MAEEPQGDKTEQASPLRREQAVKEGRFAESEELNAAFGLMLGLFLISAFGSKVFYGQLQLMKNVFSHLGSGEPGELGLNQFLPSILQAAFPAIQAAGLMTLGLIVCGMGQIGLHFNLDWLSPKFEKLNPVNGIKEIISPDSLVGFVLGILKLGLIGWSAQTFIARITLEAPHWSDLPAAAMALKAVGLVFELSWRIAFLLIMLAAADYGYKRWKHEQSMRMTRQEARDEHKQQEGDPKIKQQIREIQRQRANRRMMRDVPRATVVIANPTHVAIALRYEAGEGRAPVVLAKGEHLMAQRIKAIAAEHNVPVLEEPPLARALLRAVDVGQEIPVEFYRAVAAILAQIYKNDPARAAAGRTA